MTPDGTAAEPVRGAVQPVRASDTEREVVARQLSVACGEGRLTLEELSTRVGQAYAAVYRADLEPLVADLPAAGTSPSPLAAATQPEGGRQQSRWIVSVMGSTTRRGHWRMPARSKVLTLMAETEIDLRHALIEEPEMELKLYLLMGEQRVIVPEGVEVEVTGAVVMGERQVDVASVRPRPGVPRLHIKVVGAMGEVQIRTATQAAIPGRKAG